jgi:hypothetical protein
VTCSQSSVVSEENSIMSSAPKQVVAVFRARSAGFQPAVSPTSSRQTLGKTHDVRNLAHLQESKPEITTLVSATAITALPALSPDSVHFSLNIAGVALLTLNTDEPKQIP